MRTQHTAIQQATLLLLNPRGHDRQQVHAAYRTLASVYHPDRIADPQQQSRAAELMTTINRLWAEYQTNPDYSHAQELMTSVRNSRADSSPVHNRYRYHAQ
jgi:hypothetical protein